MGVCPPHRWYFIQERLLDGHSPVTIANVGTGEEKPITGFGFKSTDIGDIGRGNGKLSLSHHEVIFWA